MYKQISLLIVRWWGVIAVEVKPTFIRDLLKVAANVLNILRYGLIEFDLMFMGNFDSTTTKKEQI